MYHGMNPNSRDPFLEQPLPPPPPPLFQRCQSKLSLVVLWFQLALCFGPAQITGGFDELHACSDPGFPEYGYKMPSTGVFFESSVVRFHCQEGYRLKGPSQKLCERHFNGSLSWKPSDKPVCLQEGCLRPLLLPHSFTNISQFESSFPVGSMIYFQCFPGYKLEVCPLPPMVTHGDYICHPRPCEHYNHGTVVEFYCDPGYTLSNDYKYITCQYGKWFPSYQVYCIKTEQAWPNNQETLLRTWKIVAFTATSVLLMLLLVILARMFQTKFKAHFLPRDTQENCNNGPDFVVVDGVPVMLPSYDEAVSSGINELASGCVPPAGQGYVFQADDQNPPAYPGPDDLNRLPAEFDTCDSISGSSELLQSLYTSSACQMGAHPVSDRTDVINSTTEEVASTSPSIDIADEIPLMDEDP
ncbi:PREDICTED: sushi domain-containing protein 4 isoform X3 [Thamnophis sirtalis]|uniref:Sushi domain-containing protein 4 isoform X3 n=1 Tax=Thamnophis sirtalis TaxID=35019 RepID=A0A6I9YZ00_9SAUR|nr:PREDICTED: sushi domain-containing protein 4 isoform X3 [Thamnophis sirtalis]